MKRLFIISIILVFITLGAVSASENITDDANILSDNSTQKQDLNVEMEYYDYVLKPDSSENTYEAHFNNVPDDYQNSVSVYADDTYLTSMDPHVYKTLPVFDLDYGKHVLQVKFPESDKYNSYNLTYKFEIASQYIKIQEQNGASEGYVYAVLQSHATGYLTVKVDGKQIAKVSVSTDEDNAHAYVSLKDLAEGTHKVEATYSGDGNNKAMSKSATVKKTKQKYEPYMRIYTMEGKYYPNGFPLIAYGHEANVIEIEIPDDTFKKPVVRSNNITFPIYSTGPYRHYANVSTLPIGKNIIEITYPGDDKYLEKTVNITLEIIGAINYKIDIYNDSYTYLKLPEGAEGNLSVYINGTLFKTCKVSHGIANITFNELEVGKRYDIDISYTGDDYSINQISTSAVLMAKLAYPEVVTYGKNAEFQVTMSPNENGVITVNVNRYNKNPETFTIELINGKANGTLKNLQLPIPYYEFYYNNEITLSYSSESYNYTQRFAVTAKPIPAKLQASAKSITMYYGDSKTLTVKLYGYDGKVASGKYVGITINHKIYEIKTDKNGVAKLKIPTLPGTYKAEAVYSANYLNDELNYYPVAKTTIKLVVKQPLSLKTVKVKKSAKKLTLQATLKKGKTPIKNKKITFKFGSKKLTAKTNKKGIAKVTIKSSTLKKLKVGKKLTYSATYIKDTVKKTVKIQK